MSDPSTPEQALAEARRRARVARAAGEYADADALPEVMPQPSSYHATLLGRSFIEIEPEAIHSTRRFGAPITLLKRALGRLLLQHHQEITAKQTRFNIELLAHVLRLEHRLDELAKQLAAKDERR